MGTSSQIVIVLGTDRDAVGNVTYREAEAEVDIHFHVRSGHLAADARTCLVGAELDG